MKYFRMSYDEILRKRSYKNIVLLNASIPSYDYGEEGKDKDCKEPQHKEEKFVPRHANDIFDRLI